jgi:TolB-like protein
LVVCAAWGLLSSPLASPAPHSEGHIALTSQALASVNRPPIPSIVVLPFDNLSGDATRDYLADGITDSLITDLARALPGIPIVSRDTAFTYKGRRGDARQVGRELGVRYLLEGSVVPEAERVRVNAHLVETKDATQLWAERFDTERTSMLQVQDEIVGRVSRAIGLQVVDIEAQRSRRASGRTALNSSISSCAARQRSTCHRLRRR